MKVAFDAKRAFNNSRGLGQYSRQLILGLHELSDAPELLLLSSGKGNAFIAPASAEVVKRKGLLASWWRRNKWGHLAQSKGANLFHGLSNELPADLPPGLKSVVTVHDLIFLRHPYLYPWIDRQIYKRKVKQAVDRASLVIATSRQTAADLRDLLAVPEEKMEVVYQCADPVFFEQEKESPNWVDKLPKEFILCVGALEGRKNQLGLLKGMKAAGIEVPVIFVGSGKAYEKDLRYWAKQNGLEKMVSYLTGLSNRDLAVLYRKALAMAYPSLYEGFGIPLVEGMAAGTPILTSQGGVFEEIAGPAAMYADPYSPDSIGAALLEILNDTKATKQRVEAGLQRSNIFSREKFAGNTFSLYHQLLK